MGLDMYAARRIYVKRWDHTPEAEQYAVALSRGGKAVKGVDSDRISDIEEELMYWRKANHIHEWFVQNVQEGDDDCRSYIVTPDKLRELLAVCERVIRGSELVDGEIVTGTPDGIDGLDGPPGKVIKDSAVAEELLPRQAGFFFGSNDYDEYYLEDVVETRDWLTRTIADIENGTPGDIVYSSSW